MIIDLAFNGAAKAALGAAPIDFVLGASLADEPFLYEPDKARAMFEELDITDLGSIIVVTGSPQRAVEVIQQNLADVGVTVSIELVDAATLTVAMNSRNFTAAYAGVAFVNDFFAFEYFYGTTGMFNFARYSNPEVDALFGQAVPILDIDERTAVYNQIINIVNIDAPYYYILNATANYAMQPGLLFPGGEDGRILLSRFVLVD
jgi:peptide/nickel transport system substrate-binding protein